MQWKGTENCVFTLVKLVRLSMAVALHIVCATRTIYCYIYVKHWTSLTTEFLARAIESRGCVWNLFIVVFVAVYFSYLLDYSVFMFGVNITPCHQANKNWARTIPSLHNMLLCNPMLIIWLHDEILASQCRTIFSVTF